MRGSLPDDIVWAGSLDTGECLIEDARLVEPIIGVINRSVWIGGMDGSFDGPRTIVVVHVMIARVADSLYLVTRVISRVVGSNGCLLGFGR